MSESDSHAKIETLRVLHLEDNREDSALIRRALATEIKGLELLRVETRETFVQALEEFKPDVVLCDYYLPVFNGGTALQIVLQTHPQIPVIMVTGALGDSEAVNLLKMGARDYVLKNHLQRLASAVQGALTLEQGIRARKEAERAQRESEARYKAIMSTANDAIICTDFHGIVYLWNRKAEELFGYTAAEAIGLSLYDLICSESGCGPALQLFSQSGKALPAGETVQFTAKRKNNNKFPVELSVSAMHIGDEWHATGIIRDITERKQNEARIQRVNLLYAALSDCNHVIVRSKSEEELFARICQGAVEIARFKMAWVGLTDQASHMVIPVASSGEGAAEYLSGIKISVDPDSPYGQGPTGRALRENQPYWCQDFLNSALTAAWHERGAALGWRSSAALPLRRNGFVIGALSLYSGEVNAFDASVCELLVEMAADISYAVDNLSHDAERKRAEESLRKLLLAVEQSPNSIVITNLDGNLEYVNEGFVKSTGYSREEVIGKNPRILQSGKTSPDVYSDMWAHLTNGRVWKGEFINRRKDGSEYRESILASPVHAADGRITHYLGIKEDITERKLLEEQLVAQYEHVSGINAQLIESNKQLEQVQMQLMQSEKMAAIGLLAAGVAHEINNPISYVSSNLGTLEKYLADIFLVLDRYTEAEALLSADQPLLQELRQIKARIELDYVREDIKSLIAESHEGLTRVKKIVLDLQDISHSDSEDQWVWADVHQGLESTLNIVWNELKYKCELFKEYGTLPKIYCLPSQLNQVFMNLLVNAAQAINEHGKVTIRTRHEGDYIWVEVIDTGEGIPPENIPRLFDPFFTTKPVGKGTGLGLALSFKIIEKHHGRIEVRSEGGKGTTFRVILPVQPDINEENNT